jgi:hypothetical protein
MLPSFRHGSGVADGLNRGMPVLRRNHTLRSLQSRLGLRQALHGQLLLGGIGKTMNIGAVRRVIQTAQKRNGLIAVTAAQIVFLGSSSYPFTSVGSYLAECYEANDCVFLAFVADLNACIRVLPYYFRIHPEN